jgi:hypothetical protein
MPGAYAHIAAVHRLMSGNILDGMDIPDLVKESLGDYPEFCTVGAVSPDYPYLDIGNKKACEWADVVHHGRTYQLLSVGTSTIRNIVDLEDRKKCIAWLMGFVAHIGLDMTIHPIVEGIAGIYSESKENQKTHRICEMNQDVHIWLTMNMGTVGRSETIDNMKLCSDAGNTERLHAALRSCWYKMLEGTYPDLLVENVPDIDKWHEKFSFVVDKVEESEQWPRFARHVSVRAGLSYPLPAEIDPQFIMKLKTPDGRRMDYDDIFAKALIHIQDLWSCVGKTIIDSTGNHLSTIGDWNLDRGLTSSEEYVFWQKKDTISSSQSPSS